MTIKAGGKEASDYMGRIFEDICTQYLWKMLLKGNSPLEFVSLGRWWGNENVDLDILETLIARSKIFYYKKVQYYLFSKSGFTKGCMQKAKEMGNVTVVRYEDIVRAMCGLQMSIIVVMMFGKEDL